MGVTLTVLLMLVGMVGIVVPVLPGLALVAASTAVWAGLHHDRRAWVVVGVCAVVYLVGLVVRYLVPGRRLRGAGVGSWTLALSVVVALVAGVLLPVVGAPVGFVGAIFLVEAGRHRDAARAWRVTRSALAAVGVSVLVELTAAWVVASTWAAGVLLLGAA
ncbi:DUF456 domain-containing protein [Lapillicoccus jejuensis]|uniref:DUF456 domain-containing protein n=1 Tax=Lapillicoccus jejuensis TaxID=402171 RepID=A0A542E5J1_9MICO|nr:DUF456 domain-containing protein [Lapillicoccus jejuensis]TQJ10611.1 hypothetical protein FB458_3740 [Lapillicoccus jejuensis]